MLIRHLALNVSDPRKSRDFYLDTVWLDGEARDEPWGVRINLPDGFMLALIKGEPLPAEHADTVHFGCPLATRDDAHAVRDPDGYVVELAYDEA